jgi:aquaporin PIP
MSTIEPKDIELSVVESVKSDDATDNAENNDKADGDELFRGFLGEFVATLLFLFVTIATVIYSSFDIDVAAGGMSTGRHLIIALVFGISIVVLVYQFASVSGAHINPAVTCALLATGKLPLVTGALYIFAQCLGAIVGTLIVYLLDPVVYAAKGGGCNSIPPVSQIANNYGAAFGVEFMGTALLLFTVFAAIDPDNGKDMMHINGLAPLAIGLAVFLAHLIAIPITGTSINPARSLGPAVVNGCWEGHWMFWVAPILGGVVAALIHEFLIAKDRGAIVRRYKKSE